MPNKKVITLDNLARFKEDLYNKAPWGSGGSEVASPYVLQDYEIDLDNMEFSCSDADAEYIFQNNPVAISMDGVIALARDFTDDESKHDYSRSYTFFEFPDDDQIIYYEIGIYFDGEEYEGEVKPTDSIGGGNGSIKEIDADVTPGDPIIINFRNQDDLDLLKAGTLGQFILNGYVSGQLSGSYGLSISSKVGTEIKYSSVEVAGSYINITTLRVDASDTLAGGSNMYGLTK